MIKTFILLASLILTAGSVKQNISPVCENMLSEAQAVSEVKEEIAVKEEQAILVPSYSGESFVTLNNNVPSFSEKDRELPVLEYYSDLDELGRCKTAFCVLSKELMPTQPRGEIGSVKPSGWHTVKYEDLIEDRYLYNRCHLVAYQLTGENANEKNLITGTRYMNTEGMQEFENQVSEYLRKNDGRVLYRVTPIYEGNNLVASGVEMEAYSVEDQGKGISFHVFVYNVQPGISIDYSDGSSQRDPDYGRVEATPKPTVAPTPEPTVAPTQEPTVAPAPVVEIPKEEQGKEVSYILNANTKKFHYPGCSSVDSMAEKNKVYFSGSREEAIAGGYAPCKRCNP